MCFLSLQYVSSRLRIQFRSRPPRWQTDDKSVRNVFWKQNILLCILFDSQITMPHFDILLLVPFLVMIFVTQWQNLCLGTGDLLLKAHARQQFVTKMKNKSEKHKSAVLFHYSDLCHLFFLPFIVPSDKYKKSTYNTSVWWPICVPDVPSHPSWLCELLSQMLCCRVLLSSPCNSLPSSKLWILYYHQSVISAAVMVQKSAS